MVYCERQEDGSSGDIRTRDKVIGAYDDSDAGEDGFGSVASIGHIADDPDYEGVPRRTRAAFGTRAVEQEGSVSFQKNKNS